MITRLIPKLALGTVAALGFYLPTFGLPIPGSCLHPIGIAGATPSASCGGDLRECLRMSADMRQTTFGGRFVTAEDVARCTEIFNACIHGGASRGGTQVPPPDSRSPQGGSTSTSTPKGTPGTTGGGTPVPPTSTSKSGGGNQALPKHFGIMYDGTVAMDCVKTGDEVTCTDAPTPLPPTMDSRTGQVNGQLSGSTLTGTRKIRTQAHYTTAPGCVEVGVGSGPVTYVFRFDGTVSMSEGPMSWQTTRSGDCSGSDSRTNPATEGTATWSPLG
ncbi:hypothetical protein [Mycobacterium sp. Z3061]|uniref:hypothetical protein n=1 Tax=Mycobacterium sp. Z3061 TaxID=3073562 RepID=UPI002873A939|nr:hypothetical protein [Mycobacterium sp. Z3061]